MRDLEERIPHLLHDLARGMPHDLERLGQRTLQRARRRRALTATATTLVVAAIVIGGFVGIGSVMRDDRSRLPGGDGAPSIPSPVPSFPVGEPEFRGIWPSATAESLASIQRSVDEGHQPWQLDAQMTAEAFAVNVLGWGPEAVRNSLESISGEEAVVAVWHRDRSDIVTRVGLAKLGDTGANGVWTVTRADEVSLLRIHEIGLVDDGATLRVAVSGPAEGRRVRLEVSDGSAEQASAVGEGAGSEPFVFETHVTSADGSLTVIVLAIDAEGNRLAAEAFAIAVPDTVGGDETGLEGAAQPLPDAVAQTRARIIESVNAGDLAALAELIDPMTFVYNFDDGSDPIPGWREDPSVLEPILRILELPHVVEEIEGYGTFYIWPYLTETASLDEVSQQERDDLHPLEFSDEQIEQMRELGGYLGPRLAIDADGLWRNYVTGGD